MRTAAVLLAAVLLMTALPQQTPGTVPAGRAGQAHNGSLSIASFSSSQMSGLASGPNGSVELPRSDGYFGPADLTVTTASDDQTSPAVAVDSNGNSLIVWMDRRGASDYDLYAQRYDASGATLGGNFIISGDAGHQMEPAIAVDPDDNFLVVWQDNRSGTDYDIYGQRLDTNGTWVGGEFAVSAAPNDQLRPAVAVRPGGGFTVAWQDNRSGTDFDVYAQRLAVNGTLNGSAFAVSAAVNDQTMPAVAADLWGNAVVAWADLRNGANWDIYALRFRADGSANGTEFTVSGTGSSEMDAAVAANPKGEFVVSWFDSRNLNNDIFAQRFDAGGNALGGTLTVYSGTGNQRSPAVAADTAGRYIFIWMDDRGGAFTDIYGQAIYANGTKIGSEFAVSTAANDQRWPAVAVDRVDAFVAVWKDHRNSGAGDIYGRRMYRPYLTPGTLTLNISAPANLWRWSNFTADVVRGSGNAVSFDLSADGGTTWKGVLPGNTLESWATVTLRLRARLAASDNSTTPALRGVTFNFITNRLPVVTLEAAAVAVWRNTPVTMNASGLDADNDPLTWSWSQAGGPAVTLADAGTPSASFTPSASGVYTFSAVLNDGYNSSAPAFVNVSVTNRVPSSSVESADILRWKGETVHLNGTGSDPDADAITLIWTQTAGPYGYFNTSSGQRVSFRADRAGRFAFQFIAYDGEGESTPATVNLTVWSRPPVAALRVTPANATPESPVMLDGSTSSDPDGNITGFRFTFGDGLDSGWLTTPVVLHAYASAGTYGAVLTVRDDDGNETAGEPVNITVATPGAANRPPWFPGTPPANASVGVEFIYPAKAVDDDGDNLTYSLLAAPAGMGVNSTTGRISWTPKTAQAGNHTVRVQAADGRGGAAVQEFTVAVVSAPLPARPRVTIASPAGGVAAAGMMNVGGTASRAAAPVVQVEVRLDGGAWAVAAGTENWSFALDTAKLKNGRHLIEARAYDGTLYSDVPSLEFTVNNPSAAPASNWLPVAGLAVLLLLVVAAALALAFSRTRRRREHLLPADEPAGDEAPPGPATPSQSRSPEPVPAPQSTTGVVETGNRSSPESAIRNPQPSFAVEDVFLIYKDGRLIQHTTRRVSASVDADIMSGMLRAVQEFVKDSLGAGEGVELNSMEYGESKILIRKGVHVVLAAVISGGEPAGFRDEMKAALNNIEGEFGAVLPRWDGSISVLAGAKRFMAALGAYNVTEEVAAIERAKADVALASELEFYQGFVRLKVAVKNSMETAILDATLDLHYNRDALRLDRVEPEHQSDGSKIVLGNIAPREKKTAAFYLDPQICTESHIEGVLTFKDARGNLEMLKMPRKPVSVVCPIMYTDENINTAILKRMIAEELDKKDTKLFTIPPGLTPEEAFGMGKAAVQHHDVRPVREFTGKPPAPGAEPEDVSRAPQAFTGEAWYYGKAKGRDDRLVVRVRVFGDKALLEFFVASGSTLMLTGMLAELKTDLKRELEARKVAERPKAVTDPGRVGAMASVRTMLDRAEEAAEASAPPRRYTEDEVLRALYSLPRGIPSVFTGMTMEDLAGLVARGETERTPEGDTIVRINGKWYFGDPRDVGSFLRPHRGSAP